MRYVGTSRTARQGGHAEGVWPRRGSVGWSERVQEKDKDALSRVLEIPVWGDGGWRVSGPLYSTSSLTEPLKLLIVILAPPLPVENLAFSPGAYLLVRSGFGPIWFLI